MSDEKYNKKTLYKFCNILYTIQIYFNNFNKALRMHLGAHNNWYFFQAISYLRFKIVKIGI